MIPFKRAPAAFNERLLFPSNIFDLLSEDHECYVYEDLITQIDTSSIEDKYSIIGQNAYHPRSIIGILIYSYSHGVFSSRQIEKKCREDLSYMYISGMNCPNFRVLSDFRKENQDFFRESFKQTVMLATQAGMVSLGHVSLDGSKFKASTSKHKAMSYKRLKEKEEELCNEIEAMIKEAHKCDEDEDREYKNLTGYEIPEELKIKESRLEKIRAAKEALEKREEELNPGKKIEDKKQISFADKEARIMGKNKGPYEYAYNAQISVDAGNQIIVGQHVSQNSNDKQEVKPALDEIKETCGKLPSQMSCDNGYMSGDNLEAFLEEGVDTYIATGKGEKNNSASVKEATKIIKKHDFIYDEEKDVFVCPAGKELELKSTSDGGKKVYQASLDDCSECSYRKRCNTSKKEKPRTISTDDKEPLRAEMAKKMKLEDSQEIYSRRKVIVEPVFGHIKNSGFRGFNLRGIRKVRGEFSLVTSAHNIKKIVKAIFTGEVYLENGKLAPITS